MYSQRSWSATSAFTDSLTADQTSPYRGWARRGGTRGYRGPAAVPCCGAASQALKPKRVLGAALAGSQGTAPCDLPCLATLTCRVFRVHSPHGITPVLPSPKDERVAVSHCRYLCCFSGPCTSLPASGVTHHTGSLHSFLLPRTSLLFFLIIDISAASSGPASPYPPRTVSAASSSEVISSKGDVPGPSRGKTGWLGRNEKLPET